MRVNESETDEQVVSSRSVTAIFILMIAVGLVAIAFPLLVTVASILVFGWVFICVGIAQIIYASQSRTAGQSVWKIIVGFLYLLAGIFVVVNPHEEVFFLALGLSITLFAYGILQVLIRQKALLMRVPSGAGMLMLRIYRDVLPRVRKYLEYWKKEAEQIPNSELRKQALLSIKSKTFHCEGGSIYGLLAKGGIEPTIRFIVAYQTISDYLDNLCDRSTSQDPEDFRTLHQACLHALTPNAECINYYQFRQEQDDGGYLINLVKTCQNVLKQLPSYQVIAPCLHELADYYCDLQVHKHVKVQERVPRLKAWFEEHRHQIPQMKWYEFSACAGSTLGIFCLIAYACDPNCSRELAVKVKNSYFPWVQGLHILLDYFIDQEEDRIGGDLNFCTYYSSQQEITERFVYFLKEADKAVAQLPNKHFHRMINRALLGVYLLTCQ